MNSENDCGELRPDERDQLYRLMQRELLHRVSQSVRRRRARADASSAARAARVPRGKDVPGLVPGIHDGAKDELAD
jgi:hypothetical protein